MSVRVRITAGSILRPRTYSANFPTTQEERRDAAWPMERAAVLRDRDAVDPSPDNVVSTCSFDTGVARPDINDPGVGGRSRLRSVRTG